MYKLCAVRTPHGMIRPFELEDAETMAEIQLFNRELYQPVMPIRPNSYFTEEAQSQQILHDRQQWVEDRGYAFAIVANGQIVGRIALSNVVRGAWHSVNVGYWVDSRHQGRGYATEAVLASVKTAFDHLGLHRVQAAIMPRNQSSLAVIKKADFFYEGTAPRYLNINGQWEDHRIFSLTLEQYVPSPAYVLDVCG